MYRCHARSKLTKKKNIHPKMVKIYLNERYAAIKKKKKIKSTYDLQLIHNALTHHLNQLNGNFLQFLNANFVFFFSFSLHKLHSKISKC